MIRLPLIALFFEVGVVLLVVPWSVYWERNYFAESLPLLHAIITNNFIRGAISGLGIVNLVTAASELISIFSARRLQPPVISISRSSTVED